MSDKTYIDPAKEAEVERQRLEAENERKQLEDEFKEYKAIMPTFCKVAYAFMKRAKWNYKDFEDITGIDHSYFYAIKNEVLEYIEFETVLKICIGLELKADERNELLRLSGHLYVVSQRNYICLKILEKKPITSTSDFNDEYLRLYPDADPLLTNDGKR